MSTASGKQINDLAMALNTSVTRLGRRIRQIDDHQDIGRAQLSALSVLVFGGPCTMVELARAEMVSPATIHHVVAGLVDKKLARKEPDANDRRKSVIHATKAGLRFMEEAREARLEFYSARLAQLSKTEREAIATFARVAMDWLNEE